MNNDIFEELIKKISRAIVINRIYSTRVPDFVSRSVYNMIDVDVSEDLMSVFEFLDHKFYIIKSSNIKDDKIRLINLLLPNNFINECIVIGTNVYDNNKTFYTTIMNIVSTILSSMYIFRNCIKQPLEVLDFKEEIKSESENTGKLFINLMIHIISLRVYLYHMDLSNKFSEYYLNTINKLFKMNWDERFIRLVGYGQGVEDLDDLCLADYSILTAIKELDKGDNNE